MEIVFGLVLFALVAAFVIRPLLGAWLVDRGEDPRIADLEARKEAKYREIRDAQLDHAAGKLSDEDFRRQEAELRADAVAILDRLEELRGGSA
ncbi:MAG TPA: hypothetical protein VKA89_12180 [Solirubrobacterales bacterium]|nr:hypothetical protein [Solirubrobacterales bacterium]